MFEKHRAEAGLGFLRSSNPELQPRDPQSGLGVGRILRDDPLEQVGLTRAVAGLSFRTNPDVTTTGRIEDMSSSATDVDSQDNIRRSRRCSTRCRILRRTAQGCRQNRSTSGSKAGAATCTADI
jgi:hypothetical protein